MLVVWDSVWGTPKRTYFNPHENGIVYLDISPDSKYVVTLSNHIPQTISIWEIDNEERIEPIVTTTFTN
jgi:WD40 repeat protein